MKPSRLRTTTIPKTNKPTMVYVVCANDFPLSASLKKEIAELEVAKRKEIEANAIKMAQRQKMGMMDEIHYHVQPIPIIEEV